MKLAHLLAKIILQIANTNFYILCSNDFSTIISKAPYFNGVPLLIAKLFMNKYFTEIMLQIKRTYLLLRNL